MSYYSHFGYIYILLRAFCALVLGLSLILVFKFALFRKKYSKAIPSLNHSFFNVLGDFYSFSRKNSLKTGIPFTHYVLKCLTAFSILFKKEDLFCLWLGYRPVIFLNSPKAVEELLINKKANNKAIFYKLVNCVVRNGLSIGDWENTKYHRKLLQPLFQLDTLKENQLIFNRISMELVKNLRKEVDRDFTDITKPIAHCTLSVACEIIFGYTIQEKEAAKWIHSHTCVVDELLKRVINPWKWLDFTFLHLTFSGRKVKKHIDILHSFTRSRMDEQRKMMLAKICNDVMEPHEMKLLSELLMHHILIIKDLTEEEVFGDLNTVLFSTYDPISIALIWTLYHIGLNKLVMNKIQEELNDVFGSDTNRYVTVEDLKELQYLDCVVKESLRLCPPTPYLGRRAPKDMYLCGNPIPEGAILIIMPYILHRNEEQFPNPEMFDPLRFTPENRSNHHPCSFIPFFAGTRNCIAQRFSIIEIKTVLANILRNFTLESLDSPDVMVHCADITLRPSGPVRIRIRPKKNGEFGFLRK